MKVKGPNAKWQSNFDCKTTLVANFQSDDTTQPTVGNISSQLCVSQLEEIKITAAERFSLHLNQIQCGKCSYTALAGGLQPQVGLSCLDAPRPQVVTSFSLRDCKVAINMPQHACGPSRGWAEFSSWKLHSDNITYTLQSPHSAHCRHDAVSFCHLIVADKEAEA